MEYLLYNLINEIKAKMPELSLVDEDYGQLEYIDSETDTYPVTFPCVLLDAADVQWSNIQGGHQKGNATITVRLAIDCYDDTHYGSTTTEKILTRHEMVEKLHNIVQCFRPDDGAPMNRISSRFNTMNHGIKVYESQYTCTITSYHDDSLKVRISPEIEAVIDKDVNKDMFNPPYSDVFD